MSHELSFVLAGWDGSDADKASLPVPEQAHELAKLMLETTWAGIDPARTRLIVEVQGSRFRIADKTGRVELTAG